MAITKSTGRFTDLGYATETTPGTAVASTNWVPITPDAVTLKYDPKRTVVEESTGSGYIEGDVVDEDGTVGGDVVYHLRPDWGMLLLFLAAFQDAAPTGSGPYVHVGTLTGAKPTTLEFMRAGQSFQHAGQYATKIKIATSGKKPPLVTITYAGIVAPALIAPTSPTYTPSPNRVFGWKDFGSATLLSAGAGQTSIDSFEIDIDLGTVAFYGNTGTGLPSDQIPGGPMIDIKFTRLFKDSAEYTQFATLGTTPADLSFGWSYGSGANLRSVVFDMPNSVYTLDDFKQPLKGAQTEDFTVKSLAPAGAVPLTMTVTNGTSTRYTTT